MAFKNTVSKNTKLAKISRAGGRLAHSMARSSKDPLQKRYEMLMSQLQEVKEKLAAKYGRKAKQMVITQR